MTTGHHLYIRSILRNIEIVAILLMKKVWVFKKIMDKSVGKSVGIRGGAPLFC